ncbi:hypothetical protein SAMN05216206_2344 [Pseudomonas guineae]|uniref:Uncharacterized protein n=1 Tax=Pseudomonas guineae TaxID=425504 RepID=A0A1I3J165_9PSED|nr:hypothetical protein [Pseudomonas guineae]SFI53873.1 hypothetical protein SAMN05216206_2344 [Pseudomonas guineae]
MRLSPLEHFALEKLLVNAGASFWECDQERFQVLARERTNAGFYAVVLSQGGLEQVSRHQELCLTFTHFALRRGGYFVCWIEDDTTFCLEAVANQQDWPSDLSPVDIRCTG